jgi:hypothetical protein
MKPDPSISRSRLSAAVSSSVIMAPSVPAGAQDNIIDEEVFLFHSQNMISLSSLDLQKAKNQLKLQKLM